ncbi:beta-galactosidase [Daejeonella sp.]|uniref:beta-galactosidase n=1 Tax=Daejeonella sp. TaxID=2805397 RepID=UPI00398328D1
MNKFYFPLINCIIFQFLFTTLPTATAQNSSSENLSRNDHIFPPSKEASAFIDFDKRGFIIKGKRTFVVSAGIEYARVPHELWKDRLLRLKRGGFNTVEIYTFWNFHEPEETKFNFSGDRNLDAFLKLVRELDLYAIVRVGPYYCGEWNFGGYPIWLKFKPGLVARKDNPQFLNATDRFFEKLIPIVARNQIHHGGSVIMVQLENEHPESWGTVVPNAYFKHLIDKTVSLGLQVPYFFSGLHPGNDPAGNKKNLDDPARPNPWFSTEFWGVWFFNYGPQPQDSTLYDRRTWKIIAHGGNGYNVYMAHGGSNFEYNNDRDMAASYDYGAGVGQAGDLRPIYYGFKRAAWFARSFQEILTNSIDGGDESRWMVRDTSIKVNSRLSPAGSITFLDNPDKTPKRTVIQPPKNIAGALPLSLTIAGGEILPVIQNFDIAPGLRLEWAPSRLYNILKQGETTTLIAYGGVNTPIQLHFNADSEIKIIKGNENFKRRTKKLQFSALVKNSTSEFIFETKNHIVRILIMQTSLVERTWIAESEEELYIITGPSYVGDVRVSDQNIEVETEEPWSVKWDKAATVYRANGSVSLANTASPMGSRKLSLNLAPWQIKHAIEPAAPDYNHSNWKSSLEPLQMGADGDITANAWYRTKVHVDIPGTYTLRFKNLKERASLFVNGLIQDSELSEKSFTFKLEAGKTNILSIFTAHNGRNKQLFYLGGLDTIDVKGITGPVVLERADGSNVGTTVSGWKMKGGPGDPFAPYGWTETGKGNFSGPAFYRSSFTLPENNGSYTTIWRVNITSMGHGSVWVNGHNLGRYPEKIKVFGLYIPESWLKQGKNTIVVYDEDGINPGGISIQAEKEASRDLFLLTGK